MDSLFAFARRNLAEHRLRTILSATAVSLGTATIVATDIVSSGMINLESGGDNVFASFVGDLGIIMDAIGFIILLAAGFLIFNAFAMTVTQRRRQLGLLRALGMTRRQVLRQLLHEAWLTSGLGTLVGLLVGPLLGFAILRLLRLLELETGNGRLSFTGPLTAVLAGMGITTLAVWLPARRAAQIPPLVAGQEGESREGSLGRAKRSPIAHLPSPVFGGLLILALVIYLLIAPPGEWTGRHFPWQYLMPWLLIFVWLGGLGLLLPVLIHAVRWVLTRSLTAAQSRTSRYWIVTHFRRAVPLGRLALDNLGRDLRRTTLTILTFAVGLTMIVGLNGMLHFMNEVLLHEAAKGVLTQAVWYIHSYDNSSGLAQLDEANQDAGIDPDVQAAFTELVAGQATINEQYFALAPEISSPVPGFPSAIISATWLAESGMFTFVAGDWATAVPLMNAGCGLLLPPAIAAQRGVSVGDPLTISGKDGPVDCVVAGIGSGGTTPFSIISLAVKESFVSGSPSLLIVQPLPGTDPLALETEMQSLAHRLGGRAWVTTPEQEVAGIISVSDQLEGLAHGFLLLAVVAAALGMINTTMAGIAERRRELGVLRAMGATRGQVTAVLLSEAGLIGLIGGLVGLIAGTGLTVVYALSFGGIPFGLVDLNLWWAAGQSARSAFGQGVPVLLLTPFLSLGAAWLAVRGMVRDTAVSLLYGQPLSGQQMAATRQPTNLVSLPSLYFLAWRNLGRSRVRATLSALAVTLGVTMVMAANTMANGVRDSFQKGNGRPDGTAWVVNFTETSLQGVGVIILIAAAFLILNAFMMRVTQQQKEIGLFRSLGMTRRQVARLVLIEAALVGSVGTLLGLWLGPLAGNQLLSLMADVGFAITARGRPSWETNFLAVTLGLGVTLLAAWLPARQATHLSPRQALRETPEGAENSPSACRRLQFMASLMLLVGAALVIWFAPPAAWADPPRNLQMALLLSLGWLAGTLLLLPLLIGWVARGGKRPLTHFGGVVGQLVSDNLARSRQRILFTLLTFVIGLTMIVSITGVLTYLTQVLFDYLAVKTMNEAGWGLWPFDQTQGVLVADQLNTAGLRREIVDDVYDTVGEQAFIARNFMVTAPEVSAMFPNFPSTIIDLEAIGHGVTYNFVQGDWPTAQRIMAAGCGLLIPPDVAGRHDAVVGSVITLQAVVQPIDCTVAGIGVTGLYPATLISTAALEAFDVENPTALVVVPRPGADAAALGADLQALDRKYGDDLWAIKPEDSAQALQAGGDILLGMLNGMLLLALLAAGLGVVNTTMMSVAQRRPELGLLRAVGATRRQAQGIVLGEAALIGLLGGAVGLFAGMGVTVLFAMSFGGRSYGIPDIPLWSAAGQAAGPALLVGGLGLLLAPLISVGAAYWPTRALLRGQPVAVLHEQRVAAAPRYGGWRWGSLQVQFVLGTAVLLCLTLAGLIAFVVRHTHDYMDEQTRGMMETLAQWNATLVTLNLPPDAAQLSLDTLPIQQFDAEGLLRLRALFDQLGENGLHDFVITDQDDRVLFGFDPREVGTLRPAVMVRDRIATRLAEVVDGREMSVTAPIVNENGAVLGHVQLTMRLDWVDQFVRELRGTLWLVGGAIALLGVAVAYWLVTPLRQATEALTAGAVLARRGIYAVLPQKRPSWFTRHTTLRTRLTAVLVLVLVVLVGSLELLTIPIERRRMESSLQEIMLIGVEWLGQGYADLGLMIDDFGLEDWQSAIGNPQSVFDLTAFANRQVAVKLQALVQQGQNENVAYTAVADDVGIIQLSDQLSLVGTETAIAQETTLRETTWRDRPIWDIATPLMEDKAQTGTLHVGVYRESVDLFLSESRALFRLTGVIALLMGTLLAQFIGGAVAAPVQQLAEGTRRVGAGDLRVRFDVGGRDELTQLAAAYNDMVAGLQEREWLRDMFGRFVSQEVAEAIRRGQVKLEGENRVVSVLFCDIRGFTTRSERCTPQQIVALLNEYLPLVVSAAQQHEGTVNKFGGDSTLVIYGAPKPVPESAYQAILTALEMRRNLAALNERLVARGEEPIRIGVGINTGTVLAGAVGPPERQEYTVIGDTVNLASRIEALNKEYPQHGVLISDHTYMALGPQRDAFHFTDLGIVPIRGKAEVVRVWAVDEQVGLMVPD